jgi:hypothetical protein
MLRSFKNRLAIIIGTKNKMITPGISHIFEINMVNVKLMVVTIQYRTILV